MTKQYQQADRATYNITNNRFKLYFAEGDRLPDDEYKEARSLKIVFYHGQKCFSAIYSPRVEDFILRYVDVIQEDDTPDDVESRVDRYQKYAERSEEAAGYARERLANANTDRQARQAENTADYEIEKARHWQQRIAGAIAHTEYKDRPPVIVRRIKKLQASERKHTKNREQHIKWVAKWESGNLKHPETGEEYSALKSAIIKARYDRCVPSDTDSHIADGTMTPEEAKSIALDAHAARIKTADRWLNNIARRVEYETAYLVAVGGSPDTLKPAPRRKTAPPPKDGLSKGMEILYPFGGQGLLRAKILTLSSKSARVEFLDEKYHFLNRDKGHKVWRQYIRQAVTA